MQYNTPPGAPNAHEGIDTLLRVLPGAKITQPHNLTTLGAPISEEAVAPAFFKKYTDLELLAERLPDIDPHSAFFLLTRCLDIPRLQYLLHTSDARKFAPNELNSFDDLMKKTVTEILNVDFSPTSWTQAYLPVKMGGLGVRRVQDVALPGFLASVNSTKSLVLRMLPQRLHSDYETFVAGASSEWSTCFPHIPIPED